VILIMLAMCGLVLLVAGLSLVKLVEPTAPTKIVTTRVLEHKVNRVCTPGSMTSWGSCTQQHLILLELEQQETWIEHYLPAGTRVKVGYEVGRWSGMVTVQSCSSLEEGGPLIGGRLT